MRPLTFGLLAFLAAAALVAAPEVSLAGKPPPGGAAVARTVSVGSPNEGHLVGGVRLEPSEHLKILSGHDQRWGTPELVGLLARSSARVAKRFPGSVLMVGDLSRKGGGDVPGHHSHESGRDADVGFYVMDAKGRPAQVGALHSFDEQGRSPGHPGLRFDDRRNWALVESWLTDPRARINRIFVAEHLRARLLDHARRSGVSHALRERAAQALFQPKGSAHDNHFHVRIGCPDGQGGDCLEFVTKEARVDKKSKHRPVVARARKRSGTNGHRPPPAAGVMKAPDDDFDDDDKATAEATPDAPAP